jgi:type IV fimbrial biogenesis protein FimT
MMNVSNKRDCASLARFTALQRSLGFTLIELLITISVAAILMAIAAPSFRDLVAGQKIKTASYDVISALVFTRSEAIKRNANVSLVQGTGGWKNGWTIVTADAITVSSHEAFSGLNIAGPTGSLVYNRDGRITASAGLTFDISSNVASSVQARCITIDLSGLPKSKVGSC